MIDWLAKIAEARGRQISHYGYTREADAKQADGELAQAACYMAWPEPEWDGRDQFNLRLLWPVTWDLGEHSYREGKTAEERLVVAGAFILAELERLEAARGQQ
jgi:hypothetical protein